MGMYKGKVTGTREGKIKRQRTFRQNSPDKKLNNRLKHLFGISLDEYNKMLASQGGVCDIHKGPETMIYKKTGKPFRMGVDHNHATLTNRGILCSKCNSLIDWANESIEVLVNAIVYLAKHNKEKDPYMILEDAKRLLLAAQGNFV